MTTFNHGGFIPVHGTPTVADPAEFRHMEAVRAADLHPDRTDQATAPSVKPPTQETPDMDTVTTPRIPTTTPVEPAGHQKWEITDAVRNSHHERALLARGWEPFSAVNAAAQTIVLYRRRTPITITYPAGPTDA